MSDKKVDFDLNKLSQDELLTSEKDSKWPTLEELRKTNLFNNLK